MSNVPAGWENRNNEMSEHDMKLGGAAATKFANKSLAANAYGENPSGTYKTSDQVREFYFQKTHRDGLGDGIEQQPQAAAGDSLPAGWGARQKERDVQAQQFEIVDARNPTTTTSGGGSDVASSAEVALVQVATHTLNTLAATLEQHPTKIPLKDRHAFAEAMKRAMDAMAKSA
jgi:hypothetical protein